MNGKVLQWNWGDKDFAGMFSRFQDLSHLKSAKWNFKLFYLWLQNHFTEIFVLLIVLFWFSYPNYFKFWIIESLFVIKKILWKWLGRFALVYIYTILSWPKLFFDVCFPFSYVDVLFFVRLWTCWRLMDQICYLKGIENKSKAYSQWQLWTLHVMFSQTTRGRYAT